MIGLLAKHIRYALDGAERSFVALAPSSMRCATTRHRAGPVRSALRVDIAVAANVDLEMRVPPMVLQRWPRTRAPQREPPVAGGAVRVAVRRRPDDAVDLSVADDGADAGSSAHVGTRTSLATCASDCCWCTVVAPR